MSAPSTAASPAPETEPIGPARRPLVLDAGLGTRLIAGGLDLRAADPCLWNLDRPERVLALHQADASAGADAILTNTFGANRATLGRYGQAHRVGPVVRAAVALAREAAGPARLVIGSIGPLALASTADLRETVDWLVEERVDAILLETQQPGAALEDALATLRGTLDRPVWISLCSTAGLDADRARRMVDLGASVLGANCQLGMAPMLKVASRLRRWGVAIPLLVKPSAAMPGIEPISPEAFARAVPRLAALGVRLFGGCCGATEAHIAALRGAVDASP